jgi:tetratricopeptide (TPR) repeat protein
MTLDQETWVRVYPWLEKAQDVPSMELQAWIARIVAEQPDVGIPLREVLAQSARCGDEGFLDRPLCVPADRQSRHGQQVGAYTIDALLAEGGMGEVWLAHRSDGHFEGRFAVKLLHLNMNGAKALDRFKREGHVLAQLIHPNIARIIDAGATADGQPFLVLEYIDGEHVDKYCDARSLSTQSRVRLFLEVLAAVAHAHTNLIIHRDIKPSNVLVTPAGVVKLLDFGIAKLVGPDSTPAERGQLTRVEEIALTPSYAAPEQILGEPLSTATDVYQLAVLLHVLLVGRLPRGRPDASRSGHISAALGESSVRISDSVSGTLRKELRGDLDAIIEKSLRKRPQERYSTAAALAADLQRYLEHEPVSARAGMLTYRARKFVRRYRGAVLSVTAALASLMIATAVSLTKEHKIRHERDRADQIAHFMTQIFKVADPSEARGNTVTAREILEKSSQQIETGAGLDAGVQSDLLQVMADTYTNLGLYARAHHLAQSALDSRRRLLGPLDPKTLESLKQLGNIMFQEGHVAEAEESLRHTVALELPSLGAEHLLTLETEGILAEILVSNGRYAESEHLARQLVAFETRKLGQDNRLTLRSMNVLGSALRKQSRFDEAETLYRQIVAIERQSLGPDHPDTLKTSLSLANMLQEQGRYPQAEAIYRDTLAVQRRVLGDEHPETANILTTLANDLVHDRSRYAEAEKLYRTALPIEMRQVGPESRFTTRTEEGLANLLNDETRYAEAESLFREVLRVRQKVLGPDNTDTLVTQFNLADVMNNEGHYEEAERLFRNTLDRQQRLMGPDDPDVLASQYMVAETLLRQNRPREAEAFARKAFEGQLRILGPQHQDTLSGLNRLGRSLAELGRFDEAKALYTSTIREIASQPNSDPSHAWYAFGVMAAQSGHVDEAFGSLEYAAALGYKDWESLRKDGDLKKLRGDARFAKLIVSMQSRADAAAAAALR